MAFRTSVQVLFGRSASLFSRGSLWTANKQKQFVSLHTSAEAANLCAATPINRGNSKGSPLALARSALLSRTVPEFSTPLNATTSPTAFSAPQAACLRKILAGVLPSGNSCHLDRIPTRSLVTSSIQVGGRRTGISPMASSNVLTRGYLHGSASVRDHLTAFARISSRSLQQSYGRRSYTSAGGPG